MVKVRVDKLWFIIVWAPSKKQPQQPLPSVRKIPRDVAITIRDCSAPSYSHVIGEAELDPANAKDDNTVHRVWSSKSATKTFALIDINYIYTMLVYWSFLWLFRSLRKWFTATEVRFDTRILLRGFEKMQDGLQSIQTHRTTLIYVGEREKVIECGSCAIMGPLTGVENSARASVFNNYIGTKQSTESTQKHSQSLIRPLFGTGNTSLVVFDVLKVGWRAQERRQFQIPPPTFDRFLRQRCGISPREHVRPNPHDTANTAKWVTDILQQLSILARDSLVLFRFLLWQDRDFAPNETRVKKEKR